MHQVLCLCDLVWFGMEQVQFADTKATFILGANSALVSYLFSTPLVRDAGQMASLATAMRMMCMLCLLYSSYHVLKVVRPRLASYDDRVKEKNTLRTSLLIPRSLSHVCIAVGLAERQLLVL